MGAISPLRWQVWHFSCKIGATSLVNVTGLLVSSAATADCIVDRANPPKMDTVSTYSRLIDCSFSARKRLLARQKPASATSQINADTDQLNVPPHFQPSKGRVMLIMRSR